MIAHISIHTNCHCFCSHFRSSSLTYLKKVESIHHKTDDNMVIGLGFVCVRDVRANAMIHLRNGISQLFVFACMAVFYDPAAHAVDILLYDAGLNTFPESQSWLFYSLDTGAGGSVGKTLIGGGTQIATDNASRAGWSNTIPLINTWKNPSFPHLTSTEGFALEWSMQVVTESHISANRSGFSMILLADDYNGIELGFWSDEIWAQNSDPLFTHGESVPKDTTSGMINYRLEIVGNQYLLMADQAKILSGLTRNYTAFGSAPYTLNNYLFFGDNTTSAGAKVEFGSIILATQVPESGNLAMISGFLTLILWLKQKRNKWSEY